MFFENQLEQMQAKLLYINGIKKAKLIYNLSNAYNLINTRKLYNKTIKTNNYINIKKKIITLLLPDNL